MSFNKFHKYITVAIYVYNILKNIALLHSFATGLGYLVETSGHKQPFSFPLLRDLKAPCHNKAAGTPQQFL